MFHFRLTAPQNKDTPDFFLFLTSPQVATTWHEHIDFSVDVCKKKKSNTSQLADTTALIAVVNRESSLAEGALKRMLLYWTCSMGRRSESSDQPDFNTCQLPSNLYSKSKQTGQNKIVATDDNVSLWQKNLRHYPETFCYLTSDGRQIWYIFRSTLEWEVRLILNSPDASQSAQVPLIWSFFLYFKSPAASI